MSEIIRIVDLEETSIVEVINLRDLTDEELNEMLVAGDEVAIEEYLRRHPDAASDLLE